VAEIVDCPPDAIEVGMAVTVTWIDADDDLSLPAFKPVAAEVSRA
jgi:3-oxo-4,17-pregnadiene-20-carboxyl-CoA hydratase alpha subunit